MNSARNLSLRTRRSETFLFCFDPECISVFHNCSTVPIRLRSRDLCGLQRMQVLDRMDWAHLFRRYVGKSDVMSEPARHTSRNSSVWLERFCDKIREFLHLVNDVNFNIVVFLCSFVCGRVCERRFVCGAECLLLFPRLLRARLRQRSVVGSG